MSTARKGLDIRLKLPLEKQRWQERDAAARFIEQFRWSIDVRLRLIPARAARVGKLSPSAFDSCYGTKRVLRTTKCHAGGIF